tara:strand:- start:601 stop:1713 length:1113 start_codon:yes stop_codon:yes gene_type:complete
MNQTRTYGVEFEFKGNRAQVAAAIRSAGIEILDTFSYHRNYEGSNNSWELKYDSSVGRGGMEIVSPKLVGDEGLEEIKTVLTAINSTGARVDSNCGTHIHLGMTEEIEAGDLKVARNVELLATRWAHSINQLLAPSRRTEGYCRTKTTQIRIEASSDYGWNLHNMENMLNQIKADFSSMRSLSRTSYAHQRYRAINFENFVKASSRFNRTRSFSGTLPTIEIRSHQGTLNATKITNWIKLWQAIFETAATGRPATANTLWRDRGTNELSFFFWSVLKTVSPEEKKELVTFFKARAKKLNGRVDENGETMNAKGETAEVAAQNKAWRESILAANPEMGERSQIRLVNVVKADAMTSRQMVSATNAGRVRWS